MPMIPPSCPFQGQEDIAVLFQLVTRWSLVLKLRKYAQRLKYFTWGSNFFFHPSIFQTKLYYLYVYAMWMDVDACRCQKRALDALELELQVILSHLIWVLIIKLRSSAISPVPHPSIFTKFLFWREQLAAELILLIFKFTFKILKITSRYCLLIYYSFQFLKNGKINPNCS